MRGMKLSVKLPLLIVLSVFASALIIFALGAYVTRNSLRAVEMEANSNSVHAYADTASFYLGEARSVLETTAALPQITDFASGGLIDPALHGVPADAAMPQRNVAALILKNSRIFDYIMLLKADGTIYLLEPYELQIKTLRDNIAFRDWYQELMNGGNTVICDLHISNATQRPTVTIATPVRNSAGQVIGIWAGALKLEAFSQMGRAELESDTPQRYGYITDSRGLIIAHQANPKYVQEQTDFSSVPPVRAALAGQDGTMQYVSPIDGQEKLAAYMPLPGTGWAVVYLVPTQVAFAPLTQLTYITLLITVIIAILVAIVSLFMVRRQITRPMGHLTIAATKMGSGDLSQRVKVTTGDEIGQLGTEFNQMALSLYEKETQLRATSLYTRSLIEASLDPLVTISPDGKITDANEATIKVTGVAREKLIGTDFANYFTESEKAREVYPQILAKGYVTDYSLTIRNKDGKLTDVLYNASVYKDVVGNVLGIFAAARDITERKQAEEALHEAEERYHALIELGARSGEAVVMLEDTDKGIGMHVFASDTWAHMTGYSHEELLTVPMTDLIHPRFREESLARHDRRMRGEVLKGLYEIAIVRKDGTEFPVEVTYAPSTYHGRRVNVGFIRDITERKKMEEQLMAQDRLASLGQLVSGVAHELNNPLTGVIGFSDMLLKRDLPDDVKEDLKVINDEAMRTARIVKNLLTFARKQPEGKTAVDINENIRGVLNLRDHEQKVNNIRVITHFASDLPQIMGNSSQMQQVFFNIVINAEFFMLETHQKGNLTITTERTGDFVRASFADDGPGISGEHMRHLFTPFFTTKEVGKGTGLGLSICHGIITEHGGRIYAESEPGKGATFVVELPVSKQ